MSDVAQLHEQVCDDCRLPAKVFELGQEVDSIRADLREAITELRAETSRLNEIFAGHIRSLTEVTLRFNAQLEHARASMDELTTGLAELGVSVKMNMKRRASSKRARRRT